MYASDILKRLVENIIERLTYAYKSTSMHIAMISLRKNKLCELYQKIATRLA